MDKRKLLLILIPFLVFFLVMGIAFFFLFNGKERDEITKTFSGRIEDRDTATTAFEPSPCPDPKPHNKSFYSGKLIDSHFHMAPTRLRPFDTEKEEFLTDKEDTTKGAILGIDVTLPQIDCMFEYEGTNKALTFFGVASEKEEQLIGEARKETQLSTVKKIINQYTGKFIPFVGVPDAANGYPTVDARELKQTLALSPNLFRGYGEIGLYKSEGIEALPPDSERLLEIYPIIQQYKLVVYFHLGMGQKDSFRRALTEHPDINFIFHGDQLIDHTYGYDLSKIEGIISSHPNAFYTVDQLYGDRYLLRPDVSKEQFLNHFADYEPLLKQDLGTWKNIIESYPDQFMWGTDRGGPVWSFDKEVGWRLANYSRAFIARLDPEVQEKFAYKNAENLLQ